MREICLAKNIANLRKKKQITQEQLATALNVSPQAVSKWETASCQPDTMTLPLIADYFNVSIDYLFYGKEVLYDDIYEKITEKVAEQPVWTPIPYVDAHKISSAAVYGIMTGKLRPQGTVFESVETAVHISDQNGIAMTSPKGFSAVVTETFLGGIDKETMESAQKIFTALSNQDCLRVTAAIINFSDIGYDELKENTHLDDNRLLSAIEQGKSAGFLEEIPSRHKVIGKTYRIQGHHYNCICFLFAAVEMIKISLPGIQCWLNWGDFPLSFD